MSDVTANPGSPTTPTPTELVEAVDLALYRGSTSSEVIALIREAVAAEILAEHDTAIVDPLNPAIGLAIRGGYRRAASIARGSS